MIIYEGNQLSNVEYKPISKWELRVFIIGDLLAEKKVNKYYWVWQEKSAQPIVKTNFRHLLRFDLPRLKNYLLKNLQGFYHDNIRN